MSTGARFWARVLLWLHLFVFIIWFCVFRMADSAQPIPVWMIQVFILSILVVQFTWGFTVGLIVGPSRKRRDLLWWSLLPIFMPIYFVRVLFFIDWFILTLFTILILILACETYSGVLLGAKAHSGETES